MKKIIPGDASENKGHYTPGIISHGMLYISGQLSIDPDTKKVARGGIEEHARLALANLDHILTESNCCRTDVVQCRIYVSNIEQWDAVNRVYTEFFGEHKPARIVVPVGILHFGCLVEIEAIAEVNGK
jgi:reactive intermediate/imine deaminase